MWTMAQRHGCADVGIQSPTSHEAYHQLRKRTMEMVRLREIDHSLFLEDATLDLKLQRKTIVQVIFS